MQLFSLELYQCFKYIKSERVTLCTVGERMCIHVDMQHKNVLEMCRIQNGCKDIEYTLDEI